MVAQMGNRVKPIQESEAQRYLSLGYNIIGNDGKVIYQAPPQDINMLKNAFMKHMAQIASLSTELVTANEEKVNALKMVESLQQELEALKAEHISSTEEKPKKTRSKKATAKTEE